MASLVPYVPGYGETSFSLPQAAGFHPYSRAIAPHRIGTIKSLLTVSYGQLPWAARGALQVGTIAGGAFIATQALGAVLPFLRSTSPPTGAFAEAFHLPLHSVHGASNAFGQALQLAPQSVHGTVQATSAFGVRTLGAAGFGGALTLGAGYGFAATRDFQSQCAHWGRVAQADLFFQMMGAMGAEGESEEEIVIFDPRNPEAPHAAIQQLFDTHQITANEAAFLNTRVYLPSFEDEAMGLAPVGTSEYWLGQQATVGTVIGTPYRHTDEAIKKDSAVVGYSPDGPDLFDIEVTDEQELEYAKAIYAEQHKGESLLYRPQATINRYIATASNRINGAVDKLTLVHCADVIRAIAVRNGVVEEDFMSQYSTNIKFKDAIDGSSENKHMFELVYAEGVCTCEDFSEINQHALAFLESLGLVEGDEYGADVMEDEDRVDEMVSGADLEAEHAALFGLTPGQTLRDSMTHPDKRRAQTVGRRNLRPAAPVIHPDGLVDASAIGTPSASRRGPFYGRVRHDGELLSV